MKVTISILMRDLWRLFLVVSLTPSLVRPAIVLSLFVFEVWASEREFALFDTLHTSTVKWLLEVVEYLLTYFDTCTGKEVRITRDLPRFKDLFGWLTLLTGFRALSSETLFKE